MVRKKDSNFKILQKKADNCPKQFSEEENRKYCSKMRTLVVTN